MSKNTALKDTDHPAEKEAPPRKEITAPMNSLKLMEQDNMFWRMVAREAIADDLTRPIFWSVVQSKLRSFDRVAVITQSHYFDVLILYSEVGRPVIVKILHTVEIPVVSLREHGKPPEGYDVLFDPSTQMYTGVRLRDGHPHTAPHARWSDAYHELISHAVFRDTAPNAR